MTKIIGLTGGIATGKSKASEYLSDLGAKIIDFDQMTHNLEDSNEELIRMIGNQFGSKVIRDNKVDRKALGEIVFLNKVEMGRLVDIINPFLKREFDKRVAKMKDSKLIVLNAPTLFENGFASLTDGVLMVTCDPVIQMQRLMKRNGVSMSLASKMIGAQWPQRIKAELSDWTIDSSTTKENLKIQVEAWFHEVIR